MQSKHLQSPALWRALKTTASIACGFGLVLAVSACANKESGTHVSAHTLGNKDVLLTSADLRATIASSDPERGSVVCAEPSPDLAKAVEASFGGSGSVSVDVPAQVSGSAAVSIARARAEAAAQLGERLATIQLLRDGLYRACEAYANGAINELFYALLLGRYDDTMVTMLAGELAAGNFGRQLATIGGDANANANAETTFDRALTRIQDAAMEVEQAEEQVEVAEGELVQAEAERAAAEEQGEDTTAEAAEVEDKRQALKERQDNLKLAAKNAADAAATASANAGAITATTDKDIASVVHAIQATYINDKDLDALIVACLTALTNPKYGDLAKVCSGRPGEHGLLQLAVHAAAGGAAAPPTSKPSPPATDGTLIVAER